MNYFPLHLIFLFSFISFSQNHQGITYNHSPNGEMVYDTYDTFLNDEYGGLNFSFEGETGLFEKGHYKLKGEKFSKPALIRLQSEDKIRVKNEVYGDLIKIDIEEFEYYTTQVDSFFVSSNIRLIDRELTKPIVLQYLGETDKADYAMYYRFKNGAVAQKKILHTNKAEGKLWKELDINIKDPKKIFALLGFHNKLNTFYDKQERSIEDFLNTLKAEEYRRHYENKTKILYDKLWREIKKPAKATYFGQVTKIVDEIYSVQITDTKGERLFDVNYSSLQPLKKHGELIAYKGDAIKMVRTYDHGDILTSKRYMDNEIIFEFAYLKFETGEDKPQKFSRKAVSIGPNTINTYGDNVVEMEHLGNSLAYTISKKDILATEKKTLNGSIYLYSNYTEPLDLTSFEYLLRIFLNDERSFTDTMVSNDFEDSMVLEIITDAKGKALGYKILSSSNASLNTLIASFGDSFLSEKGRNRMRFKDIKLENKTDRATFILPINFEHKQFYKTFSRPNHDYWNWNWMWQQQMMWQQQQMMNQQIMNSVPKF
ncbi:hypothetical protein ACFQZJ_09135 [Maribacter chungangensis]|uniref:Uncharacterized protein n=1 Tax=Maribacter chungangensis TaxID=1069117 RepID=A0ABW3B4C7_9FLAO